MSSLDSEGRKNAKVPWQWHNLKYKMTGGSIVALYERLIQFYLQLDQLLSFSFKQIINGNSHGRDSGITYSRIKLLRTGTKLVYSKFVIFEIRYIQTLQK